MYNRYIPQPDGSYARRQYQDTPPPPPRQQSHPRQECWQPQPAAKEVKQEPVQHIEQNPQPRQRQYCRNYRPRQPQRPDPPPPPPRQEYREPPRQERREQKPETNVLAFLKQLLPKEFDTGDLLIVLLLLLMSGDCQEDQNTALLTLVLYLFL